MKHVIVVFICLLSVLSTQAQEQDSVKLSATENKLYVGIGLSNISYMLVHDGLGNVSGSIEPWITPYVGYRLTPRLNVQIGIGYGKSKEHFGAEYYESQDNEGLTYWNTYNTTWGVTVPVTLQFTPFNPNKRLQLYATAKFVTVFGSTEIQGVKRYAGTSTVSEGEGSEVNAFFVGGLLLKYKINERLDAYVEGNFLYKDLRRKNNNYANSRPMSLGLGLDYKLK